MTEAKHTSPPVPPEVLHYIDGAKDESLQFDFLIGDWKVNGKRYGPAGNVLQEYTAGWRAEYLHERRMIMDDFTVYLPSGQAVSSFVTLRTYSPLTGRWEMAGLAAFQPATIRNWHGRLVEREMHLSAEGQAPDGRTVRTRIRFYDIRQDSFNWESLTSFDEGASWIKTSALTATRAP